MSFEIGKEYNRRNDIHKNYGGQQQSGISTPSSHNLIFLFSSPLGEDFGYKDHFDDNGVFHYTGEGQVGDMTFTKGNRAIRNHLEEGKELLLFEWVKKGVQRLTGYCKYLEYHHETRTDRNGKWREAIIFELAFSPKPYLTKDSEDLIQDNELNLKPSKIDNLKTLRAKAIAREASSASERQVKQIQRFRSEAIKIYALKRSSGSCESCNHPAPFMTTKGPYLEVHHMKRLADGGPDEPSNVIAVCPNCHRRAHSSVDKKIFNGDLISKIKQKEDDLGIRS